MTLASIDWFRAAADIAGAFACAYIGQWWGYRQGRKAGRQEVMRTPIGRAGEAADAGQVTTLIFNGEQVYPRPGHTPDRDDERLGL